MIPVIVVVVITGIKVPVVIPVVIIYPVGISVIVSLLVIYLTCLVDPVIYPVAVNNPGIPCIGRSCSSPCIATSCNPSARSLSSPGRVSA